MSNSVRAAGPAVVPYRLIFWCFEFGESLFGARNVRFLRAAEFKEFFLSA